MIDQTIVDEIASHDVISFDIFDTLILRPFVMPRDLWVYIESHCGFAGFYQSRARCDVGEYADIDLQYANMPTSLQLAKLIECLLEVDLSMLNEHVKSIYDIAHQLLKKIVIASDMYLPYSTILKMLNKHGIEYEKLYLSNDIKASKSNGSMFKLIANDYSGAKILHIGDNMHSDILMPKRFGIDTMHVENVHLAFFASNRYVVQFLNKHNSIENHVFIALLAVLSHNFNAQYPIVSYWSKLNEVLGTIVTVLFLQFIAKYVRQHSILNVLFVARDGYILKDIFDKVCHGAKSTYVYCPRNKDGNACSYIDYSSYLSSLKIDSSSAIVDLTSSNFSALKTISSALNHSINEIVFMTVDSNSQASSVITVSRQMSWLFMLVECLFRAPTFPISSVKDGSPIYGLDFNMFELFFTETSNFMLAILRYMAPIAYSMLEKMHILLNGKEYLDLLLAFASSLSNFEKKFFLTLMHLSDGQPMKMFPQQLLSIEEKR